MYILFLVITGKQFILCVPIYAIEMYSYQMHINILNRYPMLARSHTDVGGFGEMSISYLKDNMGISNFGILSPNDAYGQGFQKVR